MPRAIEYFLRQDYANMELVIVDDGTDPVGDLMPRDERIRYIRLTNRLTVKAKHNRACKQARGDIIPIMTRANHRLTSTLSGNEANVVMPHKYLCPYEYQVLPR